MGGTGVAPEIIEAAIHNRKSVVTANKELMALAGRRSGTAPSKPASTWPWKPASRRHSHPRRAARGHFGRHVMALYGILNGTCNYILTEMEKRGASLATILAEAQQLGYAEADPSADVDGFDARSKLAMLAALAFGEKITPVRYFRGRHPPHHSGGFSLCRAVEAHHPADLRRAQDSRRAGALCAAGADSGSPRFWPACKAHITRSG